MPAATGIRSVAIREALFLLALCCSAISGITPAKTNKMVDVIGLQLGGDEGKGKIVDFLPKTTTSWQDSREGPNAGHTLYVNDTKVVLHQIPPVFF